MKNKYLLVAMLFGVALSAGACKKCVTCEQAGSSDVEICRKNYATPQQYDIVVNSYENSGYDCN